MRSFDPVARHEMPDLSVPALVEAGEARLEGIAPRQHRDRRKSRDQLHELNLDLDKASGLDLDVHHGRAESQPANTQAEVARGEPA